MTRDRLKYIGAFVAIVIIVGIAIIPLIFSRSQRYPDDVLPGSYSEDRLADILAYERRYITTAVRREYTHVSGFSISYVRLFGRGEFSVAILRHPSPYNPALADYYRVVLQKIDGSWQTITTPQLLLFYANYPNVPEQLIRAANAL